MDLDGWDDSEGDLLFAQDTSISGQFVQQWQLRIRAQEAALKEIANSKLRRLLAYDKTFGCVGIKVGDTVLFYKAPQRKSNPRWRGPAAILEIDESGHTTRPNGQNRQLLATFNLPRKGPTSPWPSPPPPAEDPCAFDG